MDPVKKTFSGLILRATASVTTGVALVAMLVSALLFLTVPDTPIPVAASSGAAVTADAEMFQSISRQMIEERIAAGETAGLQDIAPAAGEAEEPLPESFPGETTAVIE